MQLSITHMPDYGHSVSGYSPVLNFILFYFDQLPVKNKWENGRKTFVVVFVLDLTFFFVGSKLNSFETFTIRSSVPNLVIVVALIVQLLGRQTEHTHGIITMFTHSAYGPDLSENGRAAYEPIFSSISP